MTGGAHRHRQIQPVVIYRRKDITLNLSHSAQAAIRLLAAEDGWIDLPDEWLAAFIEITVKRAAQSRTDNQHLTRFLEECAKDSEEDDCRCNVPKDGTAVH